MLGVEKDAVTLELAEDGAVNLVAVEGTEEQKMMK